MKATFKNSVNVLVRAYMNDTLQHFNCYACAVGNMVASANGYTYTKAMDSSGMLALVENDCMYSKYENTVGDNWFRYCSIIDPNPNDNSIKEIESIGYSVDEVKKIELAFEDAYDNPNDVYNGLMAVVDVLAEIHNVDLSVKNEAKAMFVKVNP